MWQSSGAITVLFDAKDLIHSQPLTSGVAYSISAMGLYMTWGDYAHASLPLSAEIFDVGIGDVNRVEVGTSDAPDSHTRYLAWRVGDKNVIAYDENNAQWTNQKVRKIVWGAWGSRTAPTAVTNIDATTTPGLYRANSASTGSRPTHTADDFYFAVVGGGYWKYQIGWFKGLHTNIYTGYSVVAQSAFNAAGEINVVSGNNTSRVVDIFPAAAGIAGGLRVGISLQIRSVGTPATHISGDVSAVADRPGVSGAKRVTLVNGSSSGTLSGSATLVVTELYATIFRARKNSPAGSGYTFVGVPWEYSIVDLRLYFSTTDLSSVERLGQTKGFEGSVLNAPSGHTNKPGLVVFDATAGKEIAVFFDVGTYAAQQPTFVLQERTYTESYVFLKENWHSVPGLDTTSVGYDFVLSRELVDNPHPGPGQAHLNRETKHLAVNIQEKIGSQISASYGMSRLVKGTVFQMEEPVSGRRWTASIDSVSRQADIGVFKCTLLEDRGSEGFLMNSEVKIYAQGFGTGELPTVTNMDSMTDAVMGQFIQARWNATGNPFGEDLVFWISSEHGGEFYQKHQRAWSNESLKEAQRTELLTAGSWSSALAPDDDLVVGASNLNLNNAAIDAVTIVPATATNKPGTVGGNCYTWKRSDGTLAQVFISTNTIHWRVTTTANPLVFGSWSNTLPADSVMARVPDRANGLLDPYPIGGWRWLVESSNLTGIPNLPESAHYAFARIVRTGNENRFVNELFYYVTANSECQKVTQTVLESWGPWSITGDDKGARLTSPLTDNRTNAEHSAAVLTFKPLANRTYIIKGYAEIQEVAHNGFKAKETVRLRQNVGVNQGLAGDIRVLEDTRETSGINNDVPAPFVVELPGWQLETGSNPSDETFTLSVKSNYGSTLNYTGYKISKALITAKIQPV